MFIILEGVDGGGKSTLARRLQEELGGAELLHFSQLRGDPLHEYGLRFEDYRPGTDRHIICDRLHVGELVYGPLYRGESALTSDQFRWLEYYLAARGAVTVHVTQDLSTVRERLQSRGEDYLQDEHVERVIHDFSRLTRRCLTTGVEVRPGSRDSQLDVDVVVDVARYRDERASTVFQLAPGYVGAPVIGTLLVGDERGGQPPFPTTAAFLPSSVSSGRYLMRSIPDRPLDGGAQEWTGYGLVNANDRAVDWDQLLPVLGDPAVVALGAKAHATLESAGVEHGQVPHPQFMRRFFAACTGEYSDAIAHSALTQERTTTWPPLSPKSESRSDASTAARSPEAEVVDW